MATIVIPARGREALLNRAIASVLRQPSSGEVQIIVIDDGSDAPLAPSGLRQQDLLLRNPSSLGGAAARNRGIDAAAGRIVYLLDSDDYFVERSYVHDAGLQLGVNELAYCDIQSQAFHSHYPQEVSADNFLPYVFGIQKHICQTSSLLMRGDTTLRFDPSLPKHQDWDFVFVQCLLAGGRVRKVHGQIFFDRSDFSSVSRQQSSSLSMVWLNKLESVGKFEASTLEMIRFNLLARTDYYSWRKLLRDGLGQVMQGRIPPAELGRIVARRLVS